MIEHPRTGEQVTFVAESPELLQMEVRWTKPGKRAIAHVHPVMEERYEVVEGRAAFRIEGLGEREAGPGEVVVVPPGRAHEAWNPTDGPVRLRIEMRPGLRWRSFTTRLFAGEDPIALLAEHPEEIVLPPSDLEW